jgi:hypothetical protein
MTAFKNMFFPGSAPPNILFLEADDWDETKEARLILG